MTYVDDLIIVGEELAAAATLSSIRATWNTSEWPQSEKKV